MFSLKLPKDRRRETNRIPKKQPFNALKEDKFFNNKIQEVYALNMQPEKIVFSAKTCIRSYHYFKTRV